MIKQFVITSAIALSMLWIARISADAAQFLLVAVWCLQSWRWAERICLKTLHVPPEMGHVRVTEQEMIRDFLHWAVYVKRWAEADWKGTMKTGDDVYEYKISINIDDTHLSDEADNGRAPDEGGS